MISIGAGAGGDCCFVLGPEKKKEGKRNKGTFNFLDR
jgi:hypothetical protein